MVPARGPECVPAWQTLGFGVIHNLAACHWAMQWTSPRHCMTACTLPPDLAVHGMP